MSLARQYIEIVRSRGERKLQLTKVYRNLRRVDLFLMAYGKIAQNKGATTPGIDPADTVDGMSIQRIETIIEQLRQGTYTWKPVRRTYIPKKTGKRPLGIPGWNDKLLQEVMRTILDAYYEPQFSDSSHGFRPNRGCHTALEEIRRTWHGTKWFIECDLRDCFNRIDHNELLKILQRDIPDRRFLKLLKGMLAAGYMEDWRYHRTFSGVPQGGIVSPILSNIYLNELDKFVEDELVPEYTRGSKRRRNPKYAFVQKQIGIARRNGETEKLKGLYEQLRQLPSVDPFDKNYRRLRYVRYADDMLLGFAGPRDEAEEVKQRLADFLACTLKLELSPEKTLITHASEQKAKFLGYEIHCPNVNDKLTRHGTNGAKKQTRTRAINGQILLEMPGEIVKQYINQHTRNRKPIHRSELLYNSDFEIITLYNQRFQGLANYYCMAHNVSTQMYKIKYIMAQSLAKTLAAKHKKSARWAYQTYSHKFETGVTGFRCVIHRKSPLRPLTAEFGAKRIIYTRNPSYIEEKKPQPLAQRTELVTRLLANRCELCDSVDNIEVHHVRALKDVKKHYSGRKQPPDWALFMMKRRRKTIVVCHKCHTAISHGKYDGPKMN